MQIDTQDVVMCKNLHLQSLVKITILNSSNEKRLMPKHKPWNYILVSFLEERQLLQATKVSEHTKDKDFTDKPFCKAIVSDKQVLCQAHELVACMDNDTIQAFFDA